MQSYPSMTDLPNSPNKFIVTGDTGWLLSKAYGDWAVHVTGELLRLIIETQFISQVYLVNQTKVEVLFTCEEDYALALTLIT